MNEREIQEGLSRVLSQLTAAVTNTSLYSPTHPQVAQYVDRAYTVLAGLLKDQPEMTVLLIGNDLIVGPGPLPSSSASSYIANFSRILRKKAIERLTFVAGLPKPELQSFIRDLATSGSSSVRSTAFIKLGKVEVRIKKVEDSDGNGPVDVPQISPEAAQELLALSGSELDELKEMYLRVKKRRKIEIRGVDDMLKAFIRGVRQQSNPLSLLANLKSINEYTFTHVANVCILSMSQAESLGFTGEHLHAIGVASLLHDVGKVFIPEDILNKPGKLSDEERKLIETHAVKGARYLMGIEGIPKLAVLTALEHHIKYDGSGYPSIKGGWRPNIVSQLITVADVFDAMRSKRSYQRNFEIPEIAAVLKKGSGTSFNPDIVDRFFRLIRYQPSA